MSENDVRIDYANLPTPSEGVLVTLFITVRARGLSLLASWTTPARIPDIIAKKPIGGIKPIDIDDHRVTLTGNVRTWAERDAVVDAAWRAPGVSEVRDELSISR